MKTRTITMIGGAALLGFAYWSALPTMTADGPVAKFRS